MASASERLKRRALHRAFYLLGSGEALASALRLPPPELARLLSGKKEIPSSVFHDAVELILGHPESADIGDIYQFSNAA